MIKAKISPGYRVRLALVFVLFFGGGVYFLYDGYVGYPRAREIRREWQKFADEGKQEQWVEYAREKGWPDGIDGTPGKDHSDMDIFTQKLIGYPFSAIGLLFGIALLRTFGKWTALDEQGLSTSSGQKVPFDAVVTLDKARWKTKGIAVVRYREEGIEKRLVLDDWKFDREPTIAMVQQLETRLKPEQIVGVKSVEPTSQG